MFERLSFDEYKCYTWRAHLLVGVLSIAVGLASYFLIVGLAEGLLGTAIRRADVELAIYGKDPARFEEPSIPREDRISACERFLVLAHGLDLPLTPETASRSDRELCAEPKEGDWKAPDELMLLHQVLLNVGWPQQHRPTVELLVRMLEKSEPKLNVADRVNPSAIIDPSPFHTRAESMIVDHISMLSGPRDETLIEALLKERSWLKTRSKEGSFDAVWCVFAQDDTYGPLKDCRVTVIDDGPTVDSQQAVMTAFFVASLSEIRADEAVRDAFNTLTLWKGWPQAAMLVIFAYALCWQIPRTWSSFNDWKDVRRCLRQRATQARTKAGDPIVEPARALPRAIFAEASGVHLMSTSKTTKRAVAGREDAVQAVTTGLESATADFRADLAAHRGRLQVASWPVNVSAALLPMLGFIGTVVGIMDGLGRSDTMVRAMTVFEQAAAVQDVAGSLGLAFGTTFIALGFGVILTALIGFSSGVESVWMSRVELEVRPEANRTSASA